MDKLEGRPNARQRRRAARHISYFYHTFSFDACADEALGIRFSFDWTKVHYLPPPRRGTISESLFIVKERLDVKRLVIGLLRVGF